MSESTLPTYDAMMNPLLEAMRDLGGSGTISEIEGKVAEIMDISDDQLEIIHDPSKGWKTKFGYRLAWSRTYLKKFGLLENSARGVWALTPEGVKTNRVDEREVVKYVKDKQKAAKESQIEEEELVDDESEISWRDRLSAILIQMKPDAFERLIRRLLRETGFIQVEVTGRSGDGGVDGKGIMRMGGMLSFHVIFQCKRWQNTVGPAIVRDFRGAMVGRADKGLLVTTSTFSKDATREATRDGAPAIDLIDGEQLIDLLQDYSLGVTTRKIEVEEVTINEDWFGNI